jgi:hypothetical protein
VNLWIGLSSCLVVTAATSITTAEHIHTSSNLGLFFLFLFFYLFFRSSSSATSAATTTAACFLATDVQNKSGKSQKRIFLPTDR